MLCADFRISNNCSSSTSICCIGVRKKFNTSKYSKEKSNKENFLSLSEYLDIACRIILVSADRICPGLRNRIINDDDVISFIAYRLMLADWSYDESSGLTRYQWRRQNGIFAIRHYLKYEMTKRIKVVSLDSYRAPDRSMNTYSELVATKPTKDFDDLMPDNHLTEKESRYIRMRMVDKMTLLEIAESENVTWQRIQQIINSGLEKIKQAYKTSNWE